MLEITQFMSLVIKFSFSETVEIFVVEYIQFLSL